MTATRAPYPRASAWRDYALYAGLWTVLAALATTQDVATQRFYGQHVDLGKTIAFQFLNWYTCGIATPIYIWLVRRYPLSGPRLGFTALGYLAVMAGCVVLKYVVWVPLENFFFHSHWTFGAQLIPNVFGVFLDQFYFVVLLYAIEYYRSARASDLRASQLESELSQAQLTALQSQLHPHFLFNTLNSISALMHRDVEAADQMLSRLSDMLRLTLGAGDAQEVRLESELEVLARYLGIMNVRFPDRLATHVHASSEALGEFVPSFLLQPLVENVVRHGLDESSKLTNVHIFADLDPQTLTLRIVDDGRGLPPQQERKEGIGLRNTRRRIERLYGQAGTLRVASGSRGGTEVTIRIPRRPSRPEVASGLVAS